MYLRISILFLLSVLLFSCSDDNNSSSDNISVVTFNISWLGDGINDNLSRTEEDYKRIADIIEDCGADVLGLQEIENDKAIEHILKYLKGYSYFIGINGGEQNLAVLYKNDIEVKYLGEYIPLSVEEGITRPGLIIYVHKANFDFIMMNVHFKSTSRYDSTDALVEKSKALRKFQSEKLSFWIDSVLNASSERDIIIIGDFNDYPKRKNDNPLQSLLDNPSISFLTENLMSCKYTGLYSIDNIIVSTSAKGRYIQNSLQCYDFYSSLKQLEAERVSDHCPVLVRLDIIKSDND